MLGLIKKDLLMMKQNFKLYAFILIIYLILAFAGQMDISFIFPFFSVVMIFNTFAYDAQNNWDAYAISLPNGRKNVVNSKYLSTLILMLVLCVIVTIFSMIISYVNTGSVAFLETFYIMFYSALATMIVIAVMFPVIFKFGVEKGRVIIFSLIFLASFIITIALNVATNIFTSSNVFTDFISKYYAILIPLVCIGIFIISYFISLKLYSKREF